MSVHSKQNSEVARLLTQIDREYEAAQLGLSTSAQSPYNIARTGVQIGEKVVAGQKLNLTNIKVPVSLVTQDNVDSYKGWQ